MNIMRKFLGGSQGGGQPPGRAQEYHPEQVGRRVATDTCFVESGYQQSGAGY